MAAMVAAERHLWFTLSDMKERDRVCLMDAPIQPTGLCGNAVNSVVDRFQEARKQAARSISSSLVTLSGHLGGRCPSRTLAPRIARPKNMAPGRGLLSLILGQS